LLACQFCRQSSPCSSITIPATQNARDINFSNRRNLETGSNQYFEQSKNRSVEFGFISALFFLDFGAVMPLTVPWHIDRIIALIEKQPTMNNRDSILPTVLPFNFSKPCNSWWKFP